MSQDVKFCSQCGTQVEIHAKFCTNCGFKFPPQETENEVVKTNEHKVKEVQKPVDVDLDESPIDISQYFNLFEGISETTDYAISAIKESDWQNALTFIDQSIDADNNNSNFWALKSYILLKLGYFEDAITSVDISLNLDDFSQFAWACKAVILYAQGENLAAISCCNEFLILNPTNASIIQLKIDLNDKISAGYYRPVKEEVNEPETEDVPVENEIHDSIPVQDNPWDNGSVEIKSNPWQTGEAIDEDVVVQAFHDALLVPIGASSSPRESLLYPMPTFHFVLL